MATPDQINEQIKLERNGCTEGERRLSKNTKKLEDQAYASATIYGSSAINVLLPRISARIEHTVEHRVKRGTNGVAFREIHQYLTPIKPSAAAAIALKVLFDNVFSGKDKLKSTTNICASIGKALESEALLTHYEDVCPGLLNVIQKNYWHSTTGTQQKVTIVKTLMKRYDDVTQWVGWPASAKVKLGGWLLDCIINETKWFDVVVKHTGKKTFHTIEPSTEFLEHKDTLMAQAALFSPIAYPMLIEPNNWSPGYRGGYLLNELTNNHQLVRGQGWRGVESMQGKSVYAAVNKLQRVAYRLNPCIIGVAQTLMERRVAVGKFTPITELPLPPKPVDIAENYESRKAYRRAAAEVMNSNAASFKRSVRTRMTMNVAAKFLNVDRWYLPWSVDYRGRFYPIPAFLGPQTDDFGKSLIRFADEAAMTPEADHWLAFHVATCYGNGLDKQTIDERIKWVSSNHNLIAAVATDPLSTISTWEAADEPWQFLAACDEFFHCCIQRDRTTTGLPVAIDGSCSGIQILAGLTRDRSAASLVNVVPSAQPSDAYRAVADAARDNCPPIVRPYLNRSTVKRCVMTLPYNSSKYSNRSYLREALRDQGLIVDKDDLTQTVDAVRDAMERVVPGAMQTMRWISNEVREMMKEGQTEISWVTPVGFKVIQRYYKKNIERVSLKLLGRVNLFVADGETKEVKKQQHVNATAPNLIHSLDASLLTLSTNRFEHPLSTVHDSVLCCAPHMSILSRNIREAYNELFSGVSYLEIWADQVKAKTKPPIIGDLDVSEVLNSTYFFS